MNSSPAPDTLPNDDSFQSPRETSTWRAARVAGFLALACLAILLPLAAFGQTAVPDPDQLGAFLGTALQAVQAGQWSTVGVLALVAAVWGLRKSATKIPGAIGKFFKTSEGGTVLAFLAAGVTALSAAYFGGVPLTGALALTAAKAGFVAIGAWTGGRRLLRLLIPFVSAIPKVGPTLAQALTSLSGADVPKQVTAKTDATYRPLDPAPTAKQAESDLFKPVP